MPYDYEALNFRSVLGSISKSQSAIKFLEEIEQFFVKNEKAEMSNLLAKLYKGKGNIRKYIMEMSNLTTKLKSLKLELGEDLIVHLVLISLPTHFGQSKVNYNTQKDKWSLNELISHYVQEEERYGYLYLIHEKSQSLDVFKSFKDEVELQLGKKIKAIKSNRGGEYYDRYDGSGEQRPGRFPFFSKSVELSFFETGNARILEEVEFEKEENIRNVVFKEESVNNITKVLVPITDQETTLVIEDNVQTIVPDIVPEQDYDEILRDRSQVILRLSQKNYISKVLDGFGMKDSKSRDTSIAKGDKFSLNFAPTMTLKEMRCKKFSMPQQYLSDPRIQHWKAVNDALLEEKKGYMLTRKCEGLEIIRYSDSDFAGCQDSKHSTYGYIYMLAGGAIFWKSVEQTLIAPSTMATELVACFEASNHGICLQNFVTSLRVVDGIERPLKIYCDNNSTVLYSNNNRSSTKSKFINIKILDAVIEKLHVCLNIISNTDIVNQRLRNHT
ncbi:hypothetical protein CR513_35401, partial [Mucuna pruriens]